MMFIKESKMDLTKLLPDSVSTVAVIIVVTIFLRNQQQFNESLRTIASEFSHKIEILQQNFENQIDKLTTNYLNSEKIYQAQIQKLFDDFMTVSRETVVAVKQLESAVRELKEEVRGGR